MAELFLRLQKGEPLRAADKRNAIRGPVRTAVAERLARHRVFPLLGVKDKRQAWQEFAAIALLLAVEGGPCSLKGADLNDLYADQSFDSNGPALEMAENLLEDLALVAESGPGIIRTRWGFVDLYLCLMRLRTNGQLVDPRRMLDVFRSFEAERMEGGAKINEARTSFSNPDLADDPADLDESLNVKPDMLVYIQAFARDGATKENVLPKI